MQARHLTHLHDGPAPAFESSLYTTPALSHYIDAEPRSVNAAACSRSYHTPCAAPFQATVEQPALSAALRPHFQSMTDTELTHIERRMARQNAAAAREAAIEERAARVTAERHIEAERRHARVRRQAERMSAASMKTEALRIQKEYNGLGRW